MKTKLLLAALMAALGVASAVGAPLGAAFTYQGRLDDGEQPANGNYDFTFVLWDSPTNGVVVGSAVNIWALPVTDGLFTVELNTNDEFGPSAFNGSARWLEISTRTNAGGNNFVPLLPRQSLTATPYASFARYAQTASLALNASSASNVSDGAITGSKLAPGAIIWSSVTGVSVGTGLLLGANNQLSVNFAGTGAAGQAARSDHQHFGATWGGNTSFGIGLSVTNGAGNGAGLFGQQGTGSGFPYIFGNNAGVWGESSQGTGVHGASGYSGGAGLRGIGMGSSGYGVYGVALATNGSNCGVYGESKSPTGNGVFGRQNNGSGFAPISVYAGVWGDSANNYGVFGVSKNGSGVVGLATATNGYTVGVSGESDADSGTGVAGMGYANTGKNRGVSGVTHSLQGVGVYGLVGILPSNNDHTLFTAAGVLGESAQNIGVIGISDSYFGVLAASTWQAGVFGHSVHAAGAFGYSENSFGVVAQSDDGVGLQIISKTGDLIQAYRKAVQVFQVTTNGDVHVHGAFYPNGADFAEMLPAQSALEPGDVLVIGDDGKLARSTQRCQENVAGVRATQPGMIGGAYDGTRLAGKIPLAVVGVVPVKVTNENGSIHPGDRLTTSSTPGCAMKSGKHPEVGTVIGKALGALNADHGTIDMLVVLQ